MKPWRLTVHPHPLLDLGCVEARWAEPLPRVQTPADALRALDFGYEGAPCKTSDDVRRHVRDLLRVGGFKPTGRNKPASEYLIKAQTNGFLSAINVAVDLCNAVSLHSGLPISVVDRRSLRGECEVGLAPEQSSYAFNASGHVIDVSKLLCLSDAEGPCANAVKDSQRTKTHEHTAEVVYLIWGTTALEGYTAKTMAWLTSLLVESQASVRSSTPTAE